MTNLRRVPLGSLSLVLLGLGLPGCSGGGGSGSIGQLRDSDGDGLPDRVEASLGSDASDPESPYPGGALDSDDTFGPGVDALPDGLERYLVELGAATPITARTDTDLDGVPDYAELFSGLDLLDVDDPHVGGSQDFFPESGPPLDGVTDGLENYLLRRGAAAPVGLRTDTDGDGLEDVQEVRAGTDPFDPTDPGFSGVFDVDGDGAPDHFEVTYGFDPLDPNQPYPGGADDDDGTNGPAGDGILDGLEGTLRVLGAAPPITAQTDTDRDGVPDYLEALVGTDPLSDLEPGAGGGADRDADGLSDALEALFAIKGVRGPLDATSDLDGDSFSDRVEIFSGSDPLDPAEPTAFAHADIDGDGVPDFIELDGAGMDPLDPDLPLANGGDDVDDVTGPASDPISDALERVLADAGTPLPVTTFVDSDADGISNYLEVLLALDPFDAASPLPGGGLDTNATTGPAGDGISDALESVLAGLGLPLPITATGNADDDAVPDVVEVRMGTDPNDDSSPALNRPSDIDADGAPDFLELLAGTDPQSGDDPIFQGGIDTDGDRLSDALESVLVSLGAAPPVGPTTDTDGDGLPDYLEARFPSRLLDGDHPVPGAGDTDDVTGPAGDGISDALELYLVRSGASAPVLTRSDTDADGAPDYLEAVAGSGVFAVDDPVLSGGVDSDGDRVSDGLEATLLFLGAGAPVTATSDSDGDRAPDLLEALAGTDFLSATSPAAGGDADADGDGLSDGLESVLVTLGSPASLDARTDSDRDGIPDFYEAKSGVDPFDATSPLVGGEGDLDDAQGPTDTVSDALESLLLGQGARAPLTQTSDSDADGAPDYLEVIGGTDPFSASDPELEGAADPDGDGMSTALEFVLVRLGASLSPGVETDTDGDGAPDGFEARLGSHPVEADDPVHDGAGLGFDVDTEFGRPGDGLSDALAFLLVQGGATPPVGTASETDGDGIPDYFEVAVGSDPFNGQDPSPAGGQDDDDAGGPAGDGISDALEDLLIMLGATGPVTLDTDSDGDGVPDYLEVFRGTDAFDAASTVTPGVPPVATDVTFEGPGIVRALLSGSYRYGDGDLDPEGATEVRWLRDGVPIPGETLEHTVVPADFGAELTFEVTPRSIFAFPPETEVGESVSLTVDLELAPPVHAPGGPGGVESTLPSRLQLWFRSDIGLTENVTGVPGVPTWTNRASGSSDARPLFNTILPERIESAGPLGNPALGFDGSTNLQFDRPAAEDMSIFTVFQTTNVSSTNDWRTSPAMLGVSSPMNLSDIRVGTRAGLAFFGMQGAPVLSITGIADGLPHVYNTVRTGPTLLTYTDGITDRFGSTNPSPLATDAWTLGSGWHTGGYWTGELYEVLVFDRELSALERDFVTLYLHSRQGGSPRTDLVHDYLGTHPEDVFGIAHLGGEVIDSSLGSGLLGISNPTALDPGDMLIASSDRAGPVRFALPTLPPYRVRLARTWALTLTDGGTGDGVGTVDLGLYLGDIGLSRDPADYGLILADNPGFLGASLIQGAAQYDPATRTVSFPGVDLTGVTHLGVATN